MEFQQLIQAFFSELQTSIMMIGTCTAAAYLGYKKLIKQGSKEDLETTKAKTEKDVIDLIYKRLQELEAINKALVSELEQLRKENLVTRIQNEEMRNEIHQLKNFIEMNFTPTYDYN